MSVRSMLSACMGLVLCLGISGARAAELPPAPILEDDATATQGWYLRGDAGLADLSVSSRFRPGASSGEPPLLRTRADRSLGFGAGVGYRLSPYLRTDITVDHRSEGTLRATRFGSAEGVALDRADASATTVLANAYLDLALLDGVTPYLGAGIGFVHDRIGATERFSASPDGVPSFSTLPGDGSSTRLALAAMTGLAIDWDRNLKFDLGYRYLHSDDRTPRFGGLGRTFDAGEVQAHEIRIGARFQFD